MNLRAPLLRHGVGNHDNIRSIRPNRKVFPITRRTCTAGILPSDDVWLDEVAKPMIEPTKKNIVLVVALLVALLMYAASANAQRYCAVTQHGTVEIQTTPKTTHYTASIAYDVEFCGDVVLVATEQATDTGLAVTRLSAHSTQSDGVIVVIVDPDYVQPGGIIVVGWIGVSDDGQ